MFDFIKNTLVNKGFSCEENIWKIEKDINDPGQTIIINGRRVDQPGKSRHVVYEVEIFGEGDISDIDTKKIENFVEINLNITTDTRREEIGPTFCIFAEDEELFNEIINKVFDI